MKKKRTNNKFTVYSYTGFIVALCLMVSGQTSLLGQSAVGASGGNGTGPGGSAAYTIGQVTYTNFSGEGGSINLGVQQPNLFLTVGTEDAEITVSASLFPNPVSTSASLKLEGQTDAAVANNLSCTLYDLNGKLLHQQDIISTMTTIPMDHLTEGVYILQVTRDHIEIKSFKIFKTK